MLRYNCAAPAATLVALRDWNPRMTTSPEPRRFPGKTAIVTGAAGGIGRATAIAFVREGATVYGLDVDARGIRDSAAEMAGSVGCFIPLEVDVSVPADIAGTMDRVLNDGRRVDVLVNNAGINIAKRIADLAPGEWDRVVDTNLRSVYLFSQAVWPHFLTQKGGVIVNVASVMGQVGGAGSPAYCASKAGMIMLSRCLAKDGAPAGIRVNSVCPGYIDTPIMERHLREQADPTAAREAIVAKVPSGRMGTPWDVAAGILFLCSADAAYISGTELTIDGAVTATQID
jgi:NAD(P)-dependent dehydrogenase (short-subunit alcohol dehydrogenase family)